MPSKQHTHQRRQGCQLQCESAIRTHCYTLTTPHSLGPHRPNDAANDDDVDDDDAAARVDSIII